MKMFIADVDWYLVVPKVLLMAVAGGTFLVAFLVAACVLDNAFRASYQVVPLACLTYFAYLARLAFHKVQVEASSYQAA